MQNPAGDPLRPGGHPPLGTYWLMGAAAVPAQCDLEYGSHMMLFEPVQGPALDAESFGRLVLPVYAGPNGADGRLRRTQGGVRLSASLMRKLLARPLGSGDMTLTIKPLERHWWQFSHWFEPVLPLPPALSREGPHLTAPPLDEITLVEQLSRGLPRRLRRRPAERDDDWDRRRDRDDSRDSRSRGTDSPFEGKGGQSGGGGAGGAWDPGGGSRPPGVTPAGLIVGVAAGAVVGAAIAADVASSAAEGSGTETSTSY